MAKNIKGNQDGKGGRNETYTIHGRGTVARKKLAKEVKDGKHPNFSTYERDGETFVRANPDDSSKNNVNE